MGIHLLYNPLPQDQKLMAAMSVMKAPLVGFSLQHLTDTDLGLWLHFIYIPA